MLHIILETKHHLWADVSYLALSLNCGTLSWLLAHFLGQTLIWNEKGSDEALGVPTFVDIYTLKTPPYPKDSKQRETEHCWNNACSIPDINPCPFAHIQDHSYVSSGSYSFLSARVKCHVQKRNNHAVTWLLQQLLQNSMRMHLNQICTLRLCLLGLSPSSLQILNG